MRRLLSILLVAGCLTAGAQEGRSLIDSVQYSAELQTTLAAGDHNPLWLNANRHGLSSIERTNGYLRGAIARPLAVDQDRRWGIGYGLDVAVASGFTSKLIIQQAYGEVRWLKSTLTFGAKEQPMELKNQELSTGSQTFGINARPIPQVRFALPEYWTVPYTKCWLAIKGHVAYGMQTDDGWQKDFTHQQSRYTEHSLYHSKAGYLRIGPKNITFEFGLEMACQFAGTAYQVDGYTVESAHGLRAFWNALMPSGADKTDGTYQNAAGNHLGSWVARLNIDKTKWNLGVYADHFFEDNSSMLHISYAGYGEGDEWNTKKTHRYYVHAFKDWLLGAELKLKQNSWLNTIVAEYLYTKYQGGPLYHDHTSYNNEHICGRDYFYNHTTQTGWQHWGQVMGNPLYRSPLYNEDGTIRVLNNRFVAWHLGITGNPTSRLHYRLLTTWQRSYGTYDILFWDPQETVSMLGEVTYRLSKGWSLRGAMAFDTGKTYGQNIGWQLTITKQGLLKLK